MRRSYPWVEGNVIPSWATDAINKTPSGPVMTVLAEVDSGKQLQGWPQFCTAYFDVVPGFIICMETAENITNHVVRYMPIDAQEEAKHV